MPLRLPPLRDRPGDVLPLAERALRRHAASGTLPPARRLRLDGTARNSKSGRGALTRRR